MLAVCLMKYKEMWNGSSDTQRGQERQALLPHPTHETAESQGDLAYAAGTWQRRGFLADLLNVALCFSTISASVMTLLLFLSFSAASQEGLNSLIKK